MDSSEKKQPGVDQKEGVRINWVEPTIFTANNSQDSVQGSSC